MALVRSRVHELVAARGFFTVSNLAAQGVNFIGGFILARTLGPSGRGDVAIVATYDETSSRGLELGVPPAVGHHASRVGPAERSPAESQLLGAAIRISMVVAPVAASAAWLVFQFALGDTSRTIRLLVATAIVGTPIFNTVPSAGRMILVTRGQLRRVGGIVMTQALIRLILYLVLGFAGALTAVSAAVALLLSGWGISLVTLLIVGVTPTRGGSAWELVRFGIQTVPAAIATLANTRLDQILIVPILSTTELGIYAVAVGVAFIPINVGGTLGLSMFREAASDAADRRVTTFRLLQAAKVLAGTVLVSGVGAYFLIVPVYGDDFSGSVGPALLLIVGSGFSGCSSVLVQIGFACGRPSFGSWGSLCGLVVTLIGLPFALPRYGVTGAAVVSVGAYFLTALVLFVLTRRAGLVLVPLGPGQDGADADHEEPQ